MQMIHEIIEKLSGRQPLPALKPAAVWNKEIDRQLAIWTSDIGSYADEGMDATGSPADDGLNAVWSGLHLMNENLAASHALSQHIDNSTGSYWHGLMHRMEGDYSNAKYWFQEAGEHPTSSDVHSEFQHFMKFGWKRTSKTDWVTKLLDTAALQPKWNASLFIDAIEMQLSGMDADPDALPKLQQLQWMEMLKLFKYTYENSRGGTKLE